MGGYRAVGTAGGWRRGRRVQFAPFRCFPPFLVRLFRRNFHFCVAKVRSTSGSMILAKVGWLCDCASRKFWEAAELGTPTNDVVFGLWHIKQRVVWAVIWVESAT